MSATLARPSGLIITKLERDAEHGFYTARVSREGHTYHVDNRFGSWQATVHTTAGDERAEVLPAVAAALQRALPRDERMTVRR